MWSAVLSKAVVFFEILQDFIYGVILLEKYDHVSKASRLPNDISQVALLHWPVFLS